MEYGFKVNFKKMVWCSTEVKFLGFTLADGKLSTEKYLKEKKKALGPVDSIQKLERIIGILSYSRKGIRNCEWVLKVLREDLKRIKK